MINRLSFYAFLALARNHHLMPFQRRRPFSAHKNRIRQRDKQKSVKIQALSSQRKLDVKLSR